MNPVRKTWLDMYLRCYDPGNKDFRHYGGRGIQICCRWHRSNPEGFDNFVSDLGVKPTPNHTIDRINNDWSYMPSNCRWATRVEQKHNQRPRQLVTHCQKGHKFLPSTTRIRITKRGKVQRLCRICHRKYKLNYYHKHESSAARAAISPLLGTPK